jgi:hypothetical protein
MIKNTALLMCSAGLLLFGYSMLKIVNGHGASQAPGPTPSTSAVDTSQIANSEPDHCEDVNDTALQSEAIQDAALHSRVTLAQADANEWHAVPNLVLARTISMSSMRVCPVNVYYAEYSWIVFIKIKRVAVNNQSPLEYAGIIGDSTPAQVAVNGVY